jgi:hypothetical protein
MSVISSNTLFHFTNSADSLISIIKNGFYPKFCLEEISVYSVLKDENKEIASPMTCFCDLPLSQIDKHLDFYGKYGIGMSIEWGKSNGLSPILYVHDNSNILNLIKQLGKRVYNVEPLDESSNLYDNAFVEIIELCSYLKPYKGKMWRTNKYESKKFYDEREWRYIP